MREWIVPILDERTEEPKGTLTITARNRAEMEHQADQWTYANPGYVADCFQATARALPLEDVGNIRLS